MKTPVEQATGRSLHANDFHVPPSMRQARRWLVWRAELNPDPSKKPRKVPYYANGFRRGKTDTPEDWASLVSFDEAQVALHEADRNGTPYTGLGFGLGPDGSGLFWQGIDLDDLTDNRLEAEADALPGYVEWSPSGKGVHAIGYGREIENKKRGGVEMYSTGRYFTFTGQRIRGDICDISEHAVALRERHMGGNKQPVGDQGCATTAVAQVDVNGVALQPDCVLSGDTRNELWSALCAIPADGYDEWFRVGCALKTVADQGDGFLLWDAWSQRSPGSYAGIEEMRRKWYEDLPADPDGHWKAIFRIAADEYGWLNPRSRTAMQADRPALDQGLPGQVVLPSQDELALDFVEANLDRIRHCKQRGQWYKYVDGVWVEDSTGHVFDGLRNAVRSRVAGLRGSGRLLNSSNVAGAERLAQNDQRVAVTIDQFDDDQLLLNTHSGVIDLRSGELLSHDPAYLMTKIADSEIAPPETPAPLYMQFLAQVTRDDEELTRYLQRLVGYGLTGLAREHVLNFLYGGGRNGKGVFLNTITKLMGSYSGTAPSETFMASTFNAHPTELASLLGKRLVVAQEVSEGARWDEARLRMLTGGDRIAARFMRQDFFQFDPTHTLIIAGNHKPKMSTLDEAGLARMRVVPFTVTIPPEQRDPDLEVKLRSEWPAILRWAVEGAKTFLRDGLGSCDAVRNATDEYVIAEDLTAQWIEQRCYPSPQATTSLSALFLSWKAFAESGNHYVGNARKLSEELERLGYEKRRTRDGMEFRGLEVRRPPMPSATPNMVQF